MAYVSDSNLTQFWGLAKDYIKAENSRYANWQKTEKAGTVSCWPVGATELKPSVDILFTETGPAEGDKSPDNPSTITGVSSVECSYGGKNLLYYPLDALTKTIDGVTFTYNNDGSFSASGTSTRSPVIYRIAYSTGNVSAYSYLPAGTYTLSGCPENGTWSTTALLLIDDDGTFLKDNLGNTVLDYGSGRTFTIDEPKRVCCIMRLGYAVGTTISNIVYKPQLEVGSSATSLEPANRSKLSLPLGSTYYGGSIDLATGVMTVTWVGESVEVFYNTSLVGTNTVGFRFDCSYAHGAMSVTTDELICNKFVSEVGDGDNEHCRFVGSTGANNMFIRFYISKSRLDVSSAINPASPTDSEWRAAANAWLSSNPVFISYKINNPFAVQLTPTQILSLAQADKYTPRLNTVYTDASAVQVGYAKSPIRSEYELTQAIIATEGGE